MTIKSNSQSGSNLPLIIKGSYRNSLWSFFGHGPIDWWCYINGSLIPVDHKVWGDLVGLNHACCLMEVLDFHLLVTCHLPFSLCSSSSPHKPHPLHKWFGLTPSQMILPSFSTSIVLSLASMIPWAAAATKGLEIVVPAALKALMYFWTSWSKPPRTKGLPIRLVGILVMLLFPLAITDRYFCLNECTVLSPRSGNFFLKWFGH